MDFVVDNAVPLSAILLGVMVVAGLLVLVLSALSLWRSLRAAQARIADQAKALEAEGRRLSAAVEALPARQEELAAQLASLSRRLAALMVLARSASGAAAVLRAPLRYLGR